MALPGIWNLGTLGHGCPWGRSLAAIAGQSEGLQT